MSQMPHLCGQKTKRGDSPSYYIYLYKTYGNLFLHRLVFVSNLQWLSKKKKNKNKKPKKPTIMTTTLHGKYCQPSHTINTERAELRGVLSSKVKQNK